MQTYLMRSCEKIIDIAGPYCVLVKGGQACSLQIPRTAGRTAKSYLAPVSNNLLRVGANYDGTLLCGGSDRSAEWPNYPRGR